MIYFKNKFKKAKVYHNDDGEFGQQTGWLMSVPYNAFGGPTGIAKRVSDWHSGALLMRGHHARLIKLLGKKLSNKEKHGADLWTFNGFLYRESMER